MFFTKKEIIPLFLILLMLSVALGLFQSPCLPGQMPTHWNVAGEVDGYSNKTFALFFPPAITIALYLLMIFLPRIDPFRANYKKFENSYFAIRLSLVVFLFLLYFYTILVAIGFKLKINYFIIPLLSSLFLVIGLALPKIKKNYFVGIRTPWTLQSDEVWQKTHKFAGKTFIVAAVLSFFTVFFTIWAFWFFLIIISLGTLVPCLYSYLLYRQMELFSRVEEKR